MNDVIARLIPKPQEAALKEGRFAWTKDVVVIVEPGNEDDRFAAETLADGCRECGLHAPQIQQIGDEPSSVLGAQNAPVVLAGDPCRHLPLLKAMREEGIAIFPEMGDDGYALHIAPTRILIVGNTPAGVFYGFQTLIQLLTDAAGQAGAGQARAGRAGAGKGGAGVGATTAAHAEIPALSIRDWTTLRHRGLSMDPARGEVYTPEAVKAHIRRMAHFKLNMLVIYLEDAFVFPSHPDIGRDRDRLTAEEARDIDAFAKKHHVMVIPLLDSPGHMERFLADPNYAHLAEGNETSQMRAVVDVTNPATYSLLRDLYSDLCDAFSAPYHVMCGDEALGLGKGRGRAEAEAFGTHNLHIRHIKKIRAILAERGKRMIIATDPFEPGFFDVFNIKNYGLEALLQVPRDVVLLPWHYGRMDAFDFGDKAKDLGFEQHLWAWQGDANGVFPYVNDAMVNVETYIAHAHRLKALGAVCSNWGDRNSFREYDWPVIAFYSEWAWESSGRGHEELLLPAVERLYGPGTAFLAQAVRFLGNVARYFGWSAMAMESPGFRVFFDPVEPRELNEEQLNLLADFRRDCAAAREAFEKSRPCATRNVDELDFFDFALDQFSVMGDLVECRHQMALRDSEGRRRSQVLLKKIREAMPQLRRRYEDLWYRARRPRGLEPNISNFQTLERSLAKA